MPLVRRRCVFYVSGFDPKGAAHYHALYRDEALKQARAGGLELEVGLRKRLPDGNAWWPVQGIEDGTETQTHYEFMRWDDVVRAHWPRDRLQLWRDVFVATFFNLRHGSLWRMFQLAWPPALALFIPFAVLTAILLLGPVLAVLLGGGAASLAGHWLASVPVVLAVGVLLALAERRLDWRFNMYWLMRSYAFTRLQALGRAPDLEAKLDAQAGKLAARIARGGDDEILVVGHSSGAIMAAAIVARALARQEVAGAGAPTLSLLTLGQCIPLLATLPQARRFREELAFLGQHPRLHWIDFSAPPDASCFALCDPCRSLGLPARAEHPKLLSPRFADMFDAQGYRALKKDKFRMHFQYLMASERPVEYDYFRITAGAATLPQRFGHRASVTDFQTLQPFARRGSPPS
jgi:hypothetical protein